MNATAVLSEKLVLPLGARDHVQGLNRAPLTLLEYGDFECVHCGRAYWVVKEVQRAMGEQLRFAFRHFPLGTIHSHAERAAEASEAAAAQKKFWEMHDMFFENQDALEDEDLAGYARTLGIDVDRVIDEIDTGAHIGRIREDMQSAIRSGVNGTPTFFINKRRYDGPPTVDAIVAALSEVLAQRQASR